MMFGPLSNMPQGILYGNNDAPQQQPAGVLDPRYMALFNAGLSMMANSGPSRYPVGMGQIIGEAGKQGLSSYMQAAQLQRQQADSNLRRQLLGEQVKKAQTDSALQQQLLQSGMLNNLDNPDNMARLGNFLLARGQAGGATLISQAEKIRQRQAEQQQVESFKSRPGVLGAGVTTDSQQGQALLGNLTGDSEFDQAVLQAQNAALNSNVNIQPQPIQQPRPGLFAPLMTSPYVGTFAQDLQAQLDTAKGSGITPQQWAQHAERLHGQHITSTNAATARGESAALRRELAQQADNTRRMIAASSRDDRKARREELDGQRNFANEQRLQDDYSRQSKDFSKLKPHFVDSARYIAGQKYDSAGDRALVFAYAKALDPNDRVGVNDLRDIDKLAGVPERIKQAVISLAAGKELSDRVRTEIFNTLRGRFEAMNEQQQEIEDEFESMARRYMLKPENVVFKRFSIRRGKKGEGNGGWSAVPVR